MCEWRNFHFRVEQKLIINGHPYQYLTRKVYVNSAVSKYVFWFSLSLALQYIPRNMHTVFALLCFVVVIHWLIFPYPSGLLHWHCGNLTIAPVPAKQPWWIWINTSREFIMNDCITTTKQSTTKPCAYFLGYTVLKLMGDTGHTILLIPPIADAGWQVAWVSSLQEELVLSSQPLLLKPDYYFFPKTIIEIESLLQKWHDS